MSNRPCSVCSAIVPDGICPKHPPRKNRYRPDRDRSKHHNTQWRAVRLATLQRDGWVCQYCGSPANTADHVDPNTDEYTVAACGTCNSSKGTKTLDEWIAAGAPQGAITVKQRFFPD